MAQLSHVGYRSIMKGSIEACSEACDVLHGLLHEIMMQVWKLADYLSISFRGISTKIAKCPCLYRYLSRLRLCFIV
jgi:hypothetical protein